MSSQTGPTALGRRIAELREQAGLTQKELSERAQLSVTFLSEIENGRRNVSSDTLLKLSAAFGASIDFLLRGEGSHRDSRDIPAALAAVAEKQRWTFGEAIALLQAARAVQTAKSSPKGIEEWSAAEWQSFYKRVFG